MDSNGFQFQQFFVRHDRCAMRVGTDGVLLGAWADCPTPSTTRNQSFSSPSPHNATNYIRQTSSNIPERPSCCFGNNSNYQEKAILNFPLSIPHILDIGTGTGLVALMMAQRFPNAHIDALEIDNDAAAQAMDNVRNSPWKERINILTKSIQNFVKDNISATTETLSENCIPCHRSKIPLLYDAITCNPPFFVNSMKCPDDQRTLARHSDTLSPHDLITAARRLLKPNGELSIIIPFDIVSKYEEEAAFTGLLLTRMTTIRTVARKMPKRALLAFSPTRIHTTELNEQVLMNTDNSRSQWYRQITKDFYIR